MQPFASRSSVRTFNRFELKYAAAEDEVTKIRSWLERFMQPDPHGDEAAGYWSYSVYCDSPQLDFFWEKVEGIKVRRKLRFRRYAGQRDVFIEIKQRINRTVQKRRVRWPLGRVLAVFYQGTPDDATEEETADPIASQILLMWRTHDLRPTMATRYHRLALQGAFDPGLRVTFDTAVRYSADALDLDRGEHCRNEMIDPRTAIMEVKFNDRAPSWFSEMIAHFNLRALRISKYCTAVDLHHFGGRNT